MSDTEPGGRRDRKERPAGLDTPRSRTGPRLRLRPDVDPESFGRGAERFARFLGTARFLVYMTAFVIVWLLWNTLAPADVQFDPRALNYTLLTLILSLQASYAAPLILLAQNRQADRDRVQNAQDRVAGERALADTEFLTREVADLKIALRDVATRDFLRSELRTLLEELLDRQDDTDGAGSAPRELPREPKRGKGRDKGRDKRDKQRSRPSEGPPTPLDQPLGLDQPLEREPEPEPGPAGVPEGHLTDDAPEGLLPDDGQEQPVTGVPDRPHPQGLQRRP